MGHGCGCDPKVVGADDLAAVGEISPEVSVNTGDSIGNRDRLKLSEEMFHERTPTSANPSAGACNAVEQLAHGNDTDGPFFLAQ